jgi:hypothetical protein
MDIIHVVMALVVVGVLLWLINLIPMAGSIKSILNVVVIIAVVWWLVNIFGLLHYLPDMHIGRMRAGR